MVVVEAVVHGSPVTSITNNAGASKESKGLAHLGLTDIEAFCDVADPPIFFVKETKENANSCRVAEQSKHRGEVVCVLKGRRTSGNRYLHICEGMSFHSR